jgi:hypothetical protein
MANDNSIRGQILSTSSPFITLLIILSVIVGLLVVVFLAWVRFRKRGNDVDQRTIYGPLAETDVVSVQDINSLEVAKGTNSRQGLADSDLGSRSPPEVAIPESVLIGLSIGRKHHLLAPEPAPRSSFTVEQKRNNVNADMSGMHQDLPVEALIAAHKNLVEQRERFLLDARHVGLRHMTLSHLKTQQQFEKQIMEFKSNKMIISK